AVRVGNTVCVAGTTAASGGKPVAVGDAAAQARAILSIISEALEKAGAGLSDVVRTRVYLTDIADFEAVGRVHGEFFGDIRPANTTLQIAGLPNADWLVEIEADAVVSEMSE
nr:RidA family protein [Methyloceanibacter sp.]